MSLAVRERKSGAVCERSLRVHTPGAAPGTAKVPTATCGPLPAAIGVRVSGALGRGA